MGMNGGLSAWGCNQSTELSLRSHGVADTLGVRNRGVIARWGRATVARLTHLSRSEPAER